MDNPYGIPCTCGALEEKTMMDSCTHHCWSSFLSTGGGDEHRKSQVGIGRTVRVLLEIL